MLRHFARPKEQLKARSMLRHFARPKEQLKARSMLRHFARPKEQLKARSMLPRYHNLVLQQNASAKEDPDRPTRRQMLSLITWLV